MMSLRSVVVACSLVLAVVLAGCARPEESGTPTPTPTPSPTPDDVPQNGNLPTVGAVATINVTAHPETAAPATGALVCWRIEGSGVISHTAIHWDSVGHPDPTDFTQYGGGAVYPDNATQSDANGYALPGDFCTTIPVLKGAGVYYRAHAIDEAGGMGVLTEEYETEDDGSEQAASVAIMGAPDSQTAGEPALVCWRVDGSGTIPHTAIHYDSISHPDPASFSQYGGGALYPDNATSAAAEGYEVPGQFCTSIMSLEAGTLYYRAHAMGADGSAQLGPELSVVFT